MRLHGTERLVRGHWNKWTLTYGSDDSRDWWAFGINGLLCDKTKCDIKIYHVDKRWSQAIITVIIPSVVVLHYFCVIFMLFSFCSGLWKRSAKQHKHNISRITHRHRFALISQTKNKLLSNTQATECYIVIIPSRLGHFWLCCQYE